MKKIIIGTAILSLFMVSIASAFQYQAPLLDQIETYDNTGITTEDEIVLSTHGFNTRNIYVAHNYSVGSDKILYLATDQGTYLARSSDGPFSQGSTWPDTLLNEKVTIAFEGNYHASGNVMAYTNDEVYISNNAGEEWYPLNLNPDGDYLKVDYGPNYKDNEQYYWLTESGLYRKDVAYGDVYTVMESTPEEPIIDFTYYRTQPLDSHFIVQIGNYTIKRTTDLGQTWNEYTFDSPLVGVAVMPDGGQYGDVIVGTTDARLFIATEGLDFGEVLLPEEISAAYALRYIPESNTDTLLLYTDLGFYISYNQGEEWARLTYDIDFSTNPLKDFYITKSGSKTYIYMLLGNTLYRDENINRDLTKFMDGIDTEGLGYVSEGSAESLNVIAEGEEVFAPEYVFDYAMLVVEEELPEGTAIEYYMTADGENWEEVVANEEHEFVNQGNVLKWRAVLSTTDSEVTPKVIGVNVDYGLVEAGECAGFTDVMVTDPYCDAITYVKEQGIFEGYPDGTFGLNQPIVRAETVKVITEGFGIEMLEDDGTDLGFSDVEVGSWYMSFLRTAKENGVIEGYPDGTFRPSETVNYVEMMKIFLETAEAELAEVAEDGLWYDPYVDYATENGLVVYENVDEGMKRGDVAQLFYDWSK